MTFAEKAALATATENCIRLAEQIKALEAHVMAETERRMDLSQRVTALESKPATLTLGGSKRG